MTESTRRRRVGWEPPSEAKRRNPIGDWALRAGIAAFVVPLLAMVVGRFLLHGYALWTLGYFVAGAAGLFGFTAFILGLVGLQKADEKGWNRRSAAWGLGIGCVFWAAGIVTSIMSIAN